MNALEPTRRSLLAALGLLGISQVLPQAMMGGAAAAPQGYVLAPGEGEHLLHFRDRGDIFIKAGSATGSEHLAFGTQQVKVGTGIPVHRHFQMDEAFSVLQGSGTVSLSDVPHNFEPGAAIFIPRNTWHGFANPDHELLLLWAVTPAGLDGFFRDTCTPPGAPPRQLTREQIHAIARKYGTEFR